MEKDIPMTAGVSSESIGARHAFRASAHSTLESSSALGLREELAHPASADDDGAFHVLAGVVVRGGAAADIDERRRNAAFRCREGVDREDQPLLLQIGRAHV